MSIEAQLDYMIACTREAEAIGRYEHISRNPDSWLAFHTDPAFILAKFERRTQ